MELPGWPRAHDSTIDLLYDSQSILVPFPSGVDSPIRFQQAPRANYACGNCLLFRVNDIWDCYTVVEMFRLSSVNFYLLDGFLFSFAANLVLCILPSQSLGFFYSEKVYGCGSE